MVRVNTIERDRLIGAEPGTYYVTAHYLAHSSVLVRLGRIDAKALQALFSVAWNFVAGKPPGRRKSVKRKKAASVFRYL